MKDVRQYYVNNEKMGKILVIEGRVVNEFPQPVSMITVEAVLYGQNQKVIASNRQTAGNQLTPLQLSVLDKEAMASRLADPEKEQGANVTLLPGASAPFMVVFDSPPTSPSWMRRRECPCPARHPDKTALKPRKGLFLCPWDTSVMPKSGTDRPRNSAIARKSASERTMGVM